MFLLFSLLSSANAQIQAAAGSGGIVGMLLPFALIFGVFYFLVIRPQQKQRSKHQQFLTELKRGDEVVTSSGIIGTVSTVSDNIVTLEIADEVKIKILKGMVSSSAKQAVQAKGKKE